MQLRVLACPSLAPAAQGLHLRIPQTDSKPRPRGVSAAHSPWSTGAHWRDKGPCTPFHASSKGFLSTLHTPGSELAELTPPPSSLTPESRLPAEGTVLTSLRFRVEWLQHLGS